MERRGKREKKDTFLEFSFQNLTIFSRAYRKDTHEKGNLYALGQSARTRPLDGTRWKFQNNDIAGQRMLSLVEFTYTFPRDTQETNRFSLYLFRVAQSAAAIYHGGGKRCRNEVLSAPMNNHVLPYLSFVSFLRFLVLLAPPSLETVYQRANDIISILIERWKRSTSDKTQRGYVNKNKKKKR